MITIILVGLFCVFIFLLAFEKTKIFKKEQKMSEIDEYRKMVDESVKKTNEALARLYGYFGNPDAQSSPSNQRSPYQYPPEPPAAFNPFPPGRGRRLMDAPDTGQVDEATFRRTTFEFGPPAPPEKRK